ncbi:tRNA intron endonuclease, catalytic C-terminal domain containing protein [Trichomonas vaginalis G3]|uniref:tRNA-intron lyase n=1 Tax=Trichomonas vaginalis (strain ATCC PRA-98 / G3) TaxID=412133 RepID=A2FT30_TRIV3|nr:tRNA-splicing endonuclease subunit Sen34 family [Trichomonas vaginalis G3]EAX91939.1 tRNA intron endonuclease, catalytic C-terminal domain containing protein [Trichomonas vaginalis G3]KAI5497536.1 tRNA-splicing endonuclease subunit Sen34 family [Trichomonas vaginalis G3]|eukprot:XP_001304869.1 tRNA intron endonuclease, catalytic C-terminal domain containing protein [Trichomonas vaginalis G3]
MSALPRIFYEGGSWLVWTAGEVEELKKNAKVMGEASMTSPWYNHQNKYLGLPFEFSEYEVLWCAQNNLCRLVKPIFKEKIVPIENSAYKFDTIIQAHKEDDFDEEDAEFPTPPLFKYQVFCDLKKYGYTIGDGSHYTCDFAVYKNDAWNSHSSALVWCQENDFDTRNLISWVRIADGAKKYGIVAINADNKIKYIKFNRYLQRFPSDQKKDT